MRTLLRILPVIFFMATLLACKKDAFTPPYLNAPAKPNPYLPPYLNGTDDPNDSTKNRDFSIDNRDF